MENTHKTGHAYVWYSNCDTTDRSNVNPISKRAIGYTVQQVHRYSDRPAYCNNHTWYDHAAYAIINHEPAIASSLAQLHQGT